MKKRNKKDNVGQELIKSLSGLRDALKSGEPLKNRFKVTARKRAKGGKK